MLDYIVRSCQDLTDDQVCYTNDNVDERWIGHLTTHMYGLVLQRIEMITGSEQTPAAEAPDRALAAFERAATLLDLSRHRSLFDWKL